MRNLLFRQISLFFNILHFLVISYSIPCRNMI